MKVIVSSKGSIGTDVFDDVVRVYVADGALAIEYGNYTRKYPLENIWYYEVPNK